MPIADEETERAGRILLEARRSGAPAEVPAFRLETTADAYRIQDRVAARLGPVAGWKVGAPSRDATPFCAPLLAGTVAGPAERHDVRCPAPIGVEVEIAFVLGRAFPAAARPPERDDILAAIASCHIGIELCAMRWRGDPNAVDPLWKLADNQINESFLLGPEIESWRNLDLRAPEARLIVGGKTADTPRRPNDDDLLGLLVWLVRHCVKERGGIAAGAAITTGSWTGMHFVTPPAKIEGRIGDLAPIKLALRGDAS
jgi:2-keto-4-pentenoate hydratase